MDNNNNNNAKAIFSEDNTGIISNSSLRIQPSYNFTEGSEGLYSKRDTIPQWNEVDIEKW